jgi:hypothetical protein
MLFTYFFITAFTMTMAFLKTFLSSSGDSAGVRIVGISHVDGHLRLYELEEGEGEKGTLIHHCR